MFLETRRVTWMKRVKVTSLRVVVTQTHLKSILKEFLQQALRKPTTERTLDSNTTTKFEVFKFQTTGSSGLKLWCHNSRWKTGQRARKGLTSNSQKEQQLVSKPEKAWWGEQAKLTTQGQTKVMKWATPTMRKEWSTALLLQADGDSVRRCKLTKTMSTLSKLLQSKRSCKTFCM